MSGRQDVKTPGEMLQEAREGRVMTVEQLAGITKIPERLLYALERDEHHKLSGPLYVKSFLGTYAEELGLDPHEIIALYELQSGLIAPGGTAEPEEGGEQSIAIEVEVQKVGIAYGPLGLRLLVLVAVLALVALVVWLLSTGRIGGGGGADGGGGDEGRPAVESLLSTAEDLPARRPVVTDSGGEEADDASLETALPAPENPVIQEPQPSAVPPGAETGAAATATGDPEEAATPGLPGAAAAESAGATGQVGSSAGGNIPLPQETEPSRRLQAAAVSTEDMLNSPDRLAGAWVGEGRKALPSARRGDGRIIFSNGGPQPLVLRLICQQPASIRVAVDDQPAQPVAWPPVERIGRLPAARVEAGSPYAVRQGLVVYWGAAQRFSVLLGRREGIAMTLNGVPLAAQDLLVGEEFSLEAGDESGAAGAASRP